MDSVGFRILSMYMNNQKLSQSDFLALFPDTRFRYIHDYKVNEEGKKITRQGTNVLDLSLNKEGFGTFFTVNGFPSTGKAEEANLVSLNASYVDFDIDPKKYPTQEDRDSIIQEAIMRGVEAGIPTPTVINRTWKGVHLIWLYPEKLSPTLENVAWWRNVQKRLVHFYNGDRNCTDPTRAIVQAGMPSDARRARQERSAVFRKRNKRVRALDERGPCWFASGKRIAAQRDHDDGVSSSQRRRDT